MAQSYAYIVQGGDKAIRRMQICLAKCTTYVNIPVKSVKYEMKRYTWITRYMDYFVEIPVTQNDKIQITNQ
jgi:hypothetical protein